MFPQIANLFQAKRGGIEATSGIDRFVMRHSVLRAGTSEVSFGSKGCQLHRGPDSLGCG